MQADDESASQRTPEHKKDVASSILGNITPDDNPIFLKLRVGEFVRTEFLHLDLFAPPRAFRLTSHIVQVALVCI